MKSHKGQSLFEVVVAVGVIALIMVGVVTLSTRSIRNSRFARDESLATKHAQELLEWLRNERDNSWSGLTSKIAAPNWGLWCLPDLSWTSSVAGVCNDPGYWVNIPGTFYKREIQMDLPSPERIDVTVWVYWWENELGQEVYHEGRSDTSFTKWQ